MIRTATRNIKAFAVMALAATAVFLACREAERPPSAELNSITLAELREHMNFLASDSLGGRKTGESGYWKAVDYVVRRFRMMGLEPAVQDAKGIRSFLQAVPLERVERGRGTVLTITRGDEEFTLPHGGNNFLLFYPGKGTGPVGPAPMVFVGYGIHEPALGWDDYAGLDLKGKWAVLMTGVPAHSGNTPAIPEEVRALYGGGFKGELKKLAAIVERGAVGILLVPDQQMALNWRGVELALQRADILPVENYPESVPADGSLPAFFLHPDLMRQLFRGRAYDPVARTGNYRPFVLGDAAMRLAVDVTRLPFTSHNVVAMVRGSDPNLRDEYITIGAHLDHLGRQGGEIFNGANDNASGCTALLEVAEAVAMKPPRRSVIFILYTAEEVGHLGSLHFVEHPPVPLEKIKVNIDLEHVGRPNRSFEGFEAIGPQTLREALIAASKKLARAEMQFESLESRMSTYRGSDNYSFFLKNVPAVLLGSGNFPEYHTPKDDANLIDFEHLRKAAQLAYATVMELANRDKLP